jgi:hypothetical protein
MASAIAVSKAVATSPPGTDCSVSVSIDGQIPNNTNGIDLNAIKQDILKKCQTEIPEIPIDMTV